MLGQRIVLHYEEHRGIPTSCYGETGHFVTHVQEVVEPASMPGGPGDAAGAARP
jgi:hypothetical protein